MRKAIFITLSGLILFSCNPHQRTPKVYDLKESPSFNADSAYQFIEDQVGFGFRIPGTDGHQACGDYLVARLSTYGFAVSEQVDTMFGFGQNEFPLRNIIGSINPEAKKRVLLCAHWDSRPYADQGDENQDKPIVGANDNASGVAVVLEIARLMGSTPPNVGIDIVLFDMEDQGRPAYEENADTEDHGYCLGSEYWCLNSTGPKQDFGIFLNMVGANQAEFTMEHFSWTYANSKLLELWDIGNQLGYGKHFIYNRTHIIYDDHMHVNQIANIPCIAVIHQDVRNRSLFWEHWHTDSDNLDNIQISTLQAVGSTCVQMIYNQ